MENVWKSYDERRGKLITDLLTQYSPLHTQFTDSCDGSFGSSSLSRSLRQCRAYKRGLVTIVRVAARLSDVNV